MLPLLSGEFLGGLGEGIDFDLCIDQSLVS
jgi:hypothetical protein